MTRLVASLMSLLFASLQYVGGSTETLAHYFPEIKNDLTKVTWEHGVNSKEKMEAALKGDAMMLEADIVLGHTSEEAKMKKEPFVAIMTHPPETVSPFTLEQFLEMYHDSNAKKGIKLDFKSRDAFAYSESLIDKLYNNYYTDYPVWLNADILAGPVNGSSTVVDADYFLSTCISRYPTATISIGWSTRLEPGSTEGQYTQEDISRMTDALNRNMVITSSVTFAVRAAFAARSVDILASLIQTSSSESTTLTIWSSVDTDVVDVKGLKELVQKVGRNKLYFDLPKDMLNAVVTENAAGSISAYLPSLTLVAAISIFMSLFV